MATRIGDLAIVISANTSPLASGLAKASASVSSFAGSVAHRMGDVGRSIRDAFGGAGGVAAGTLIAGGIRSAAGGMRDLVTSSLELAKAAEVSSVKFEAMLGSVQKAAALQKDLKDFAAASPVSLAAANESGVRLLSAGIDQEQVAPTLRALTEIAGGDPQQVKDAVRAYTQVASTGRLQGDEWNQFANLGTINFKDLAAVLKHDNGRAVAVSEVKGLIERGKVSFEDLGNAIKKATEEGGRFYGQTARYSDTYAGRLDKLTDAWDETKREFGKGIMEGLDLKGAVTDVTKMVEKAKEFGTAIGGVAKVLKGIALPVVGAVADATSALYKAGRTAALWVRGELDTYRRGEAAKAQLLADDERASGNVARYGLARPDAFSLATYQDFAAKALADQTAAQNAIDAARAAIALGDITKTAHKYHEGIIRTNEPLAAAASEARAKADAMVADILKRGDPSKIQIGKDGRPFVPPKSDFPARLADLGTRLNERFADPIKKFTDDMADLTKLRNAGRLDPNVYEAGLVDLRNELAERAGLGGGPRLAPTAELGSQQLANIVGMAAGQGPGKNDVPTLLEAIRKLMEEQNRTSREIEQGVKAKPPTMTMPE